MIIKLQSNETDSSFGWLFSYKTLFEHISHHSIKMHYLYINTGRAAIFLCMRELSNTKTDLAVPRRKSAFGQKCLKSNHQNLMIYLKNVSTMPTPNADSLFHVIVSIILIYL